MKKLIALSLAAVMALSLVACGGNNETTTQTPAGTTNPGTTTGAPSTSAPTTGTTEPAAPTTLSEKLLAEFKEFVKANPDKSGADVADLMVEQGLLAGRDFGTMGFLDAEFMTGFNEGFEPVAFKKATFIGPMISSTPFLAYVFELNEGTDAVEFANYLKKYANPAWNVCVTAEQVLVGTEGNLVFFVMCSEQEAQVADYNQMLVDQFDNFMYDNANASVEEIANNLSEVEGFPLSGMYAEKVEKGYLTALGEFDKFENAACFKPIIGSVPFIGYIFEIDPSVNVQEFINTLKGQANLRWNICTSAEEILTGYAKAGDRSVVMFVMCPANEGYYGG